MFILPRRRHFAALEHLKSKTRSERVKSATRLNNIPFPVGAGDVTRCFQYRAAVRGGGWYGGPWFRHPGSQKTSPLCDVHAAVKSRVPPWI